MKPPAQNEQHESASRDHGTGGIRDRGLMVLAGLLAAFLLQLYVNSVAGWSGWSFGMRRFVGCTPLFVVGAAHLVEVSRPRRVWPYLVGVTIALAVWNILFAFQYYFGLLPRDDYLTFAQFVTDKFRLLPLLLLHLVRG